MQKKYCLPKSSDRPTSWSSVPTFKSGIWNFQFVDNCCLLVAFKNWQKNLAQNQSFRQENITLTWLRRSHVSWHVRSPGAEISQYSETFILLKFLKFLLKSLSVTPTKNKLFWQLNSRDALAQVTFSCLLLFSIKNQLKLKENATL